MLGTNESFIIRKASLSPSGDHQWAMWECRSSSRINKCYLKSTVEMWAQWPTNICPWYLHCICTFSIQCVWFYHFTEHSLFLSYPFNPRKSRCKGRKKQSNGVRISWIISNVNREDERTIRVKRMRTIINYNGRKLCHHSFVPAFSHISIFSSLNKLNTY